MKHIAIVGGGIAGLQAALFLQQQGVPTILYTEWTSGERRGQRLSSIVVRNGLTRDRERALGIDDWDREAPELIRLAFYIAGPKPLSFSGELVPSAHVVDMRIYTSRLLDVFTERGGLVVVGRLNTRDVDQLAAEHDLVVVASGRGSLSNIFERMPEHSPYSAPQRLVVAGLYRGVRYPDPLGYDVVVAPRHGEIFVFPMYSFEPGLTGIGIEIATGGGFEVLRHVSPESDPRAFEATVLSLLQQHAPHLHARVDTDAFGISRPLDIGHVAITPIVRRGYARLSNGRFAVALGDAHVLLDPVTGQGANTASHAARVLGEAIVTADSFDEAFCQRVEQQIRGYALPVSDGCNARFEPPQPHTVPLLLGASQRQLMADVYAASFNYPDRWWRIVSSPERSAALLERSKSAPPGTQALALLSEQVTV